MKNVQTLRVWNIKNNNKQILKNSQKSIKAFSIIELSIVLIIMGLLVAGITGGQSLIESAKVRGVINEMENIKRAVNAYYVLKGRLPGDPENVGQIAGNFTFYKNYDFAGNSDYDNNVVLNTAAFYDMDKEGTLDFKNTEDGSYYLSKTLKGDFWYGFTNLSGDDVIDLYKGLDNMNLLDLHANYGEIPVKIVESLDKKTDDGIYNTGSVRGDCTNDREDASILTSVSYGDAVMCKDITTKLDI